MSNTNNDPLSHVAWLRDLRSEKEAQIGEVQAEAESKVQILGIEVALIDQTIGNVTQLFPQLAAPALTTGMAAKPEKTEDWVMLVLSLRSGDYLTIREITQECLEAGWTTSSSNPESIITQALSSMRGRGLIGRRNAKIQERKNDEFRNTFSYV